MNPILTVPPMRCYHFGDVADHPRKRMDFVSGKHCHVDHFAAYERQEIWKLLREHSTEDTWNALLHYYPTHLDVR